MFQVRRAIIMAAGRGERLRPVTDTVPKPMIPVNGVPMIVSILRALQRNGIDETVIVTGYLAEAFEPLRKEFPGIRLIHNPVWAECNNISSMYAAREFLPGSIVLDGDQVIRNPEVLSPEAERSGYNAVWTEQQTGEWLMTLDGQGIVTGCSRNGGSRGWQLYSVSRWSREDGLRLAQDVEETYETGKRDIYWDDVPFFVHPEHYRLGVRAMAAGDVTEIDSLEELKEYEQNNKGQN